MKNPKFNDEWFKLDNAAKIYPSAKNSKWNAVFRVSVVLKEQVDPEILQEALGDVIKRYPSFSVVLKRGLFWYYFQYLDGAPKVQEENDYPCAPIPIDGRNFMFRVMYYKFRITMEFFHSLTDGSGATKFMNTLLLRYFDLMGKPVNDLADVLHYSDDPSPEEVEDSFRRYQDKKMGKLSRKEESAYQIRGTRELDGILNLTNGCIDSQSLYAKAKTYGASVSQYLSAVLAFSCYNIEKQLNHNKKKLPVKIQVPVNLRGMLPSNTLRNFSSFVFISIDTKEEYTFEQVLESTKQQLKENINKEYFIKGINANVEVEKNFFIRIAPLFLKSIILNLSFYLFGEKLFTSPISNMGVIKTPTEFNEYIDRYEFALGAPKYNTTACAVATFNKKTIITFSRTVKDTTLEREFFRFLANDGLNITLYSNREG